MSQLGGSLGPVGSPAPLRASPRSSAPAAGYREAFESVVGRGEVGGGAGGGGGREGGGVGGGGGGWRGTLGNKGISENERRDEPRDEGSGGGLGALLLRVEVGVGFPQIILGKPTACSAQANHGSFPRAALPLASLFLFFSFSYKKQKQTNRQTQLWGLKSEGKAAAGPGLGNRTIKPRESRNKPIPKSLLRSFLPPSFPSAARGRGEGRGRRDSAHAEFC